MKSKMPIISIQQLLGDERLLKMIELDLDKGNSYKIRAMDGSLTELKDSESLRQFLKDRNIK